MRIRVEAPESAHARLRVELPRALGWEGLGMRVVEVGT